MNSLFRNVTRPSVESPLPAAAPKWDRLMPASNENASATARAENAARILIGDLALDLSVGIRPDERRKRQKVVFTLDIETVMGGAPEERGIDDLLSYDDVVTCIRDIAGARHHDLIENLAEEITARLFENERISAVDITIRKPEAFAEAAYVGTRLSRRRESV